MKSSLLLSVIVLTLAVCSQTFAQAPQPSVSQDVRAEFDQLKRDVMRLNKEVSNLKQMRGPTLEEHEEVVAYLNTQAASASALKLALLDSEEKGFTYGINPDSRIILLAGIEQLCTSLETGLPGSGTDALDDDK